MFICYLDVVEVRVTHLAFEYMLNFDNNKAYGARLNES